jgi:hypothetical protein
MKTTAGGNNLLNELKKILNEKTNDVGGSKHQYTNDEVEIIKVFFDSIAKSITNLKTKEDEK